MSDPGRVLRPHGWTTPDDVADEVLRIWNKGRILAAHITGPNLFPLKLRLRTPTTADYGGRFEDVRNWIRLLESGSKGACGRGYEIEWSDIRHRQLGRQRVPAALSIECEEDALALIGKQADARHFADVVGLTRVRCVPLLPWLERAPLTAVERASEWPRILDVLDWFVANPRSGRYVRQIDIPGVDTKFIEDRRSLLSSLLDLVLSGEEEHAPRVHGQPFEGRFGLRAKPALVRLRLLDPRIRVHGISDLTVPVEEFARLQIGVQRVFITENEINGLAFPELPDALVVFGLGYGVDLLKGCEWLQGCAVHYWGDIDTHGFAMLDRMRAMFSHVRSLLMDRETLLAHRAHWGREEAPHVGTPTRLSDVELQLFHDLREGRFGERLRLEQERVGYGWLERALRDATVPA